MILYINSIQLYLLLPTIHCLERHGGEEAVILDNIINSNIALIVIPLYFVAIFGESIFNHFFHERGSGDWKDNGMSMGMGLVSAVTNGATAFISVGALFWAQQFQLYAIPLSLTALLVCFILDDLRFYWHHRVALTNLANL